MEWSKLSKIEREVLNAVSNGSFEVTGHCLLRMIARGLQNADLLEAARTAISIDLQRNKRFKIVGIDRWDHELTLIVEVIEDVLIVTVF